MIALKDRDNLSGDKNKLTEKSGSGSSPSTTKGLLGLASVGAGAYHGYCDAQGIPFNKENLELGLTYGPAIVQGAVGAVTGGLRGLRDSKPVGLENVDHYDDNGLEMPAIEMAARGVDGAVADAALGVAYGGIVGVVKGGLQTLIGYGVGYFIGYALK